jgi:hypothetical protein
LSSEPLQRLEAVRKELKQEADLARYKKRWTDPNVGVFSSKKKDVKELETVQVSALEKL